MRLKVTRHSNKKRETGTPLSGMIMALLSNQPRDREDERIPGPFLYSFSSSTRKKKQHKKKKEVTFLKEGR